MADRNDEEILRAILEKGGANAKKIAAEAIGQQPPVVDDPQPVKEVKTRTRRKGIKRNKVAGSLYREKYYYGPDGTIVDKGGNPAPERVAKMLQKKDEDADKVIGILPKPAALRKAVNGINVELKKSIGQTGQLIRTQDQVMSKMPELFGQFELAIRKLTEEHEKVVRNIIKQNEDMQDQLIEALSGIKAPTKAGGAVARPKKGKPAVGGSKAAPRRTDYRNFRQREVMDRARRIQAVGARRTATYAGLGLAAGAAAGIGAGMIAGGGKSTGPTGNEPSPGPQTSNIPGMIKLVTPISKREYVVAAQYANNFKGFVDELENSGYKIRSIGGYANRNIAGTGQKSFHSLGVAIDINPDTNPHLFDGRTVTDMPSNVSAMAAKYGLGWGGNWRTSKDTMHFSMASAEGGAVAIDRSGVAPLPGAPATPGVEAMVAAGTAITPPIPTAGGPERQPTVSVSGSNAAILDTIRTKESRGNYTIKNYAWPKSTASGAYQFTGPTWRGLTKKYGIGTEYTDAFMAPPEVQDAVADKYVSEILRATNGDVSKVPVAWYTGNVRGEISAAAVQLNRGLTPQRYQAEWMAIYQSKAGTTGTVTAAVTSPTAPPVTPTQGAGFSTQETPGRTERAGGGSFIMPVDGARQTSGFGPRWGRSHEGIDYAGPIGTPIKAASDGEVVFAGGAGGYGNLVAIKHGNGYVTRYAHLNAIGVQVGMPVRQGQVIGALGNTGQSTGPHLHFEIRRDGETRGIPGGVAMDPAAMVGGGTMIAEGQPQQQTTPSSAATSGDFIQARAQAAACESCGHGRTIVLNNTRMFEHTRTVMAGSTMPNNHRPLDGVNPLAQAGMFMAAAGIAKALRMF